MRINKITAAGAWAILLSSAGFSPQASAEVTIDITEVADPAQPLGFDVTATGSGTIDLADLVIVGGDTFSPAIQASIGLVAVGGGTVIDIYSGSSGPSNFGSGAVFDASSGTGDDFGTCGCGGPIGVPSGYVSGSPLSGSATWDNATFSSLGLTTGIYTWTWGTGRIDPKRACALVFWTYSAQRRTEPRRRNHGQKYLA
jgi:hypothetical protein